MKPQAELARGALADSTIHELAARTVKERGLETRITALGNILMFEKRPSR